MSSRLTPSSLSRTGTMFDKVDNRSPGPGAYENNRSSLSSSGSVMSFRAKDLSKNTNPGPGAYSTQSGSQLISSSAASFTVRPKTSGSIFDEISKSSNTKTGPGRYDTGFSTLSRQGSIIAGKFPELKPSNSPGPNQYSTGEAVRSLSNRAPGYSMTFSDRKVFEASKMQKVVPGPGAFSYKLDTLEKRGTGPFAKDGLQKKVSRAKSPGVGAYNVDSKFGKKSVPSYSFGSRHSVGSTF